MVYYQQPLWLGSDTATLQLSLSQWSLVPHWPATPVLCWCFKFWNHDIWFQAFSQNQRKMSSLLVEYGRIILKLHGTFYPNLNSPVWRQKITITVQMPGENPHLSVRRPNGGPPHVLTAPTLTLQPCNCQERLALEMRSSRLLKGVIIITNSRVKTTNHKNERDS